VFRALSTHFDKTLEFGMVKSTDEELIKKLKIKSFPAFLLFKGGEAKPIKYDGDTYTY
jgi:thioredoxin-related protein